MVRGCEVLEDRRLFAVSSTGLTISLVEGIAASSIVATFTSDDPLPQSAANYSAVVDWGDGTNGATAILDNGSGGFDLLGTHTYAEAGVYALNVQVSDQGTFSASAFGTAVVADAPLSASGTTLNAIESFPFNGLVARFTDANPGATSGDFLAAIDWGDGTIDTGTIQTNVLGGFDVHGSHTYAEAGNYTPSIQITDVGGATAHAGSTAIVDDAALAASGTTIHATEGKVLFDTLASFIDTNVNATAGDFSAVIDWGDGSGGDSDSGIVRADGLGGFVLFGAHTYDESGSYVLSIQILDHGRLGASVASTAVVDDAAITAVGAVVSATEGTAFNGVLASFTDANSNANAGDFFASIDWGDGTLGSGTIQADGLGGFQIVGTHTYAAPGTYTPSVQVDDLGGAGANASSTVIVADAALDAEGTSIAGTEGNAWSGAIATFTDANPAASAGDFTAEITWGDGEVGPGTIQSFGAGHFSVLGAHVYAEEGQYAASIQINDFGGSIASVASTVVIDDAALTGDGRALVATEGNAFLGTVATFVDANPASSASDFSAVIDWGDGTSDLGTIQADGLGGFDIVGTHTYAEEGSYALVIQVSDQGGSSSSIASTSVVADAALDARGTTLGATEGTPFLGVVASFTDANPGSSAGEFTASIDWGDGLASPGTIQANGVGGFYVFGVHTYAEEGNYALSVRVGDAGGSRTVAAGVAIVDDAALSAVGTTIGVAAGVPFQDAVVAHFTDANPAATAGDFRSTIDWGDGSSSPGIVRGDGNGGFVVLGAHLYAATGSNLLLVRINDEGGAAASAGSTVTVGTGSTELSLSVSPNPAVFGDSLSFSATVAPDIATSATPGGTVTFRDGTTILGTEPLRGGVAVLTTRNLPVGTHTLTATYSGDSHFGASTGSVAEAIASNTTHTTLVTSAATTVSGQSVTLSAAVTVESPGSDTATGQVTFLDGTTVLGTSTVNGGVATLVTTALSVGGHSFQAIFSGDPSHTGSTSAPLAGTVAKASSVEQLAVSSPSAPFGTSITFVARVGVVSPGVTSPTGLVFFLDGTTVLGSAPLIDHHAQFTTSTLATGDHQITAIYSGDAQTNAFATPALIESIGAAPIVVIPVDNPPVASTGSGSATASVPVPDVHTQSATPQVDTSGRNGRIVLTSQTLATTPGNGRATGTVTYFANGHPFATRRLDHHRAPAIVLPRSLHGLVISLRYNGDAHNSPISLTPVILGHAVPRGSSR